MEPGSSVEGDSTDSRAFNKVKEFFTGSNNSGNSVETSTSQDDPKYDMSHSRKRVALILNNNFRGNPQLSRAGSDIDAASLKETLVALQFEVTTKNDLTLKEMKDSLSALAKEDHSGTSCVLVAILSHGDQGVVMCNDNHKYKLEEFYGLFSADNCTSLAGKPKMLIVQACQGTKTDAGTTLRQNPRTASDGPSNQSYRIPNRADFITVISTVPGYFAFRNPGKGSWFIQSFTKVLQENAAKLDFLSMMTYVARKVATFESDIPGNPAYNLKKQVPYITSTLIREIWLCERTHGSITTDTK